MKSLYSLDFLGIQPRPAAATALGNEHSHCHPRERDSLMGSISWPVNIMDMWKDRVCSREVHLMLKMSLSQDVHPVRVDELSPRALVSCSLLPGRHHIAAARSMPRFRMSPVTTTTAFLHPWIIITTTSTEEPLDFQQVPLVLSHSSCQLPMRTAVRRNSPSWRLQDMGTSHRDMEPWVVRFLMVNQNTPTQRRLESLKKPSNPSKH